MPAHHDTHTAKPTLTSLSDYIAALAFPAFGMARWPKMATAISNIGAGLFFAIDALAPGVLSRPDARILIFTSSPDVASDSGRWLSLFARLHSPRGISAIHCCTPYHPKRITRPNTPLAHALYLHPPQKITYAPLSSTLHALDHAPDAILIRFANDCLDFFHKALLALPTKARGAPLIVVADTYAECLLLRHLMVLCGYLPHPLAITTFPFGTPTQNDEALARFSIGTSIPPAEAVTAATPEHLRALNLALRQIGFVAIDLPGWASKPDEVISDTTGSRITACVGGLSIPVVQITSILAYDLASGRVLWRDPEHDDPDVMHWANNGHIPQEALDHLPSLSDDQADDDIRLALFLWLGYVAGICPPLHDHAPEAVPFEPPTTSGTKAPPSVETPNVEPIAPPLEPDPTVAMQLPRDPGTLNVLALAALLGTPDADITPLFARARSLILKWLTSKGFDSLDPQASIHQDLAQGELTVTSDNDMFWALRYDDRRAMLDGAIWRVEIALLRLPRPAISLRLMQLRSSAEAPSPASTGIPSVIVTLAQELGLRDAGVPLRNVAIPFMGSPRAGEVLCALLQGAARVQPVIITSGATDASIDRLARRLTGVAHIITIDPIVANHLCATLGSELSVPDNALRLYRPGFSTGADPSHHRIWLRKAAQLPKLTVEEIVEEVYAISVSDVDLDVRAPSFQSIRDQVERIRHETSEAHIRTLRTKATDLAASKDEQIARLTTLQSEQDTLVTQLQERIAQLETERENMRADMVLAIQVRNSAREEVRQLRYQISAQWGTVGGDSQAQGTDASITYPDTWEDLEAWVEIYGHNRIVLHPRAAKAARASSFLDISLAYQAMDWLVRYYVPMRQRSAKEVDAHRICMQALATLALEESTVGLADDHARYRHEYERLFNDGRRVTLDRHLKRGNSFSGEYSFRLYFTYDAEAGQVLIGHLPTHLTNTRTH